jgi:hypothetical protein
MIRSWVRVLVKHPVEAPRPHRVSTSVAALFYHIRVLPGNVKIVGFPYGDDSSLAQPPVWAPHLQGKGIAKSLDMKSIPHYYRTKII